MKEMSQTITYNGRIYPLVCNLNVLETIQQKYGSIEAWGEITEAGENKEPDINAVKFGFTEMINEGLEIESELNGTEFKPLTTKQVGRIISEVGFAEATRKLNQTVIDSTQSAEKNE